MLPPNTPWAHVIMVLDQSDTYCGDPRAYLALQARIFRAMRDFLQARGIPFHLLWTREIGPRDGRQHTHCLVPLPPELAEDLAAVIYRAGKLHDLSNNRAVVVQTNRRNGNTGIVTPASLAGVMRDWLKCLSPRAQLDGRRILTALDADNRGQVPSTIHGKRSGTSESLSRKARKAAGWRELDTLPELRQALPTGEEARQERDRRKRQDRRAKRGPHLGRASGRRHLEPQPASPWDGADLSADFLEG
jgi:hypothetical protein